MAIHGTSVRPIDRRRDAERLVWRFVTAIVFTAIAALILQQPDRAADAAPIAPPPALVGSGATR